MSERFKIIQSEHLSSEPARWLASRANLVVVPHDDPKFDAALATADGLIVRTYTQVNRQLLDKAPLLRVVGRAGIGLENIDLPACRAKGVKVVYAPDSNTQAVVEYVLALICDALRPRVTVSEPIDRKAWEKLRQETFGRRQISDLTLGILGLGRIGKRVAQVASAIGCQVLYHDIVNIPLNQRHGAQLVVAPQLFEKSDIVSIHIDSRPANRGYVNADLINRMKRDVLFINTSRGMVVDAAALATFLKRNQNAKAMIDVHEPEPIEPGYPLLGLKNALLYPHLAGRTETAMTNMSWVVKDVLAVLEGKRPQFPAL